MDEKERLESMTIKYLIENGLITFGGAVLGGLALGPEGLALGSVVASGGHLLASTWGELLADQRWKEVVLWVLKIAVKFAIENFELLLQIGRFIIKVLKRIINGQSDEAQSMNCNRRLYYS